MTARLIARGFVIATLVHAADVLSQNVATGEVGHKEISEPHIDTDQTSNTATTNDGQTIINDTVSAGQLDSAADLLEVGKLLNASTEIQGVESSPVVQKESLDALEEVSDEPDKTTTLEGQTAPGVAEMVDVIETAEAPVGESAGVTQKQPEPALGSATHLEPVAQNAVVEAQEAGLSASAATRGDSMDAAATPPDAETPIKAPSPSSAQVADEESRFEPSLDGQAAPSSLIAGDATKLDKMMVAWIEKEGEGVGEGETKSSEELASPTEPAKILVERIVSDDDLATAAANVRKSWQILAPERIEAIIRETDDESSTAMQVAMLASVLADIVGNLDFVKNAAEPLVYIRGQSVGRGSQTTSTTTPRTSLSLLAGNALGFPLSLASRASQSFIGQAMGSQPKINPTSPLQPFSIPTSAPTLRSSPFSSLWPNGAIPKLQSDDNALIKSSNFAKSRTPSFTPSYSPLAQTGWNLYSSLIPRKLSEEVPTLQQEHKERFGNFLHDELPRELKRKIWEDFVSDSRRARSAEEQNALLRKLERGQDYARTRSPPRVLIEAENRPITVAEKVTYGAEVLKEIIKSSDFSVTMVEAARLFLATLEPNSQTQLMQMLVDNGVKHDGDFIEYKKTHEVDAELQIGLLLLNRLKNVLIKAEL